MFQNDKIIPEKMQNVPMKFIIHRYLTTQQVHKSMEYDFFQISFYLSLIQQESTYFRWKISELS
jgi:hypothetical protein